MPELSLKLGDLHLDMVLAAHEVEAPGGPYCEWLACEVFVSVASFAGRFRWDVMPAELLRLADDLAALHKSFKGGAFVEFKPAEPNVALSFRAESAGHIEGSYRLFAEPVNGAVLQGLFAIDQSYLPGIVLSLRQFVREAIRAA